jgi:hypothetical protein
MLKGWTVTILIVGLLLSFAAYCNDSDEVLIETWSGSPELPDDMAYNTFLAMITGNGAEPGFARRKLGMIFGIQGHTQDGADEIDELYSWFLVSRAEIEQEVAAETVVLLCSGDWESMGREDVIHGIEAHSLFRESVTRDHYEATLRQLPDSDRAAFQAYIEKVKLGTGATRYNGTWYQVAMTEAQLAREHNAFCEGAFKRLAMH